MMITMNTLHLCFFSISRGVSGPAGNVDLPGESCCVRGKVLLLTLQDFQCNVSFTFDIIIFE